MTKLLTEGTLVVAGLTAFLFLIGGSYEAGYFNYFGFDFDALEEPIYVTLVWSINPLLGIYAKLQFVIAAGLVLSFLSSFTFRGRAITARIAEQIVTRDTKRWLGSLFSSMLIPLCFILLILWSHSQGAEAAAKYYRHPTETVYLTMKKEDRELFETQLLNANTTGKLMLLGQSKELVLTFIKSGSVRPKNGIFIIPGPTCLQYIQKRSPNWLLSTIIFRALYRSVPILNCSVKLAFRSKTYAVHELPPALT